MTNEREEHVRGEIVKIRRLCEDRVWSEDALRKRNIELGASIPALLDWLTEALDENAALRRLLDQSLMLVHLVGAYGGMTDKDHATEADIRRKAGI